MGWHGLSCRWSEGRHQRLATMNNIICHALTSAGVPPGLLCSDGKWPDGVSLVPWWSVKFLVRDATCADTFNPSYRSLAVHAEGAVVGRTESLKEEKYFDLLHTHEFVPITVESSGVFGPQSLAFAKDLAGSCSNSQERRRWPHTLSNACPWLCSRGMQLPSWQAWAVMSWTSLLFTDLYLTLIGFWVRIYMCAYICLYTCMYWFSCLCYIHRLLYLQYVRIWIDPIAKIYCFKDSTS